MVLDDEQIFKKTFIVILKCITFFIHARPAFSNGAQCFQNRTGPAGSTGPTANRPCHRSGLVSNPEGNGKPLWTGRTIRTVKTRINREPAVLRFSLKFKIIAIVEVAKIWTQVSETRIRHANHWTTTEGQAIVAWNFT